MILYVLLQFNQNTNKRNKGPWTPRSHWNLNPIFFTNFSFLICLKIRTYMSRSTFDLSTPEKKNPVGLLAPINEGRKFKVDRRVFVLIWPLVVIWMLVHLDEFIMKMLSISTCVICKEYTGSSISWYWEFLVTLRVLTLL